MRLRDIATGTALALLLLLPGSAEGQAVCQYRGAADALEERPSPLDSVAITLGGDEAKLCYGRPSARGRTMVGGEDPYGTPWRFGANEPTTIHLPFAAAIGTVPLGPGAYTLYAIPEADRWTIVVNANVSRWGIPISPDVRSSDIGSFPVDVSRGNGHVEQLTFDFEGQGSAGELVFSWEDAVLRIPISRN